MLKVGKKDGYWKRVKFLLNYDILFLKVFSNQKVRKIENYLDKKELQNEKGLDKYIDMILTEKAEKKVDH